MHGKKPCGQGFATHKNNLIGTAARGWNEIGPFKHKSFVHSFLLALVDLLETSSLDCAEESPQPYTIW